MQIELVELIKLISTLNPPQYLLDAPSPKTEPKHLGQNIVVLDRGFVYVGNVTDEGEYMRVTACKNVRFWGTKNGLGELRNGPLAETKLDEVGEILFTKKALIHLVPCKGF